MTESIRGALFPMPHELAERLFSGQKDVFVKFTRFRYLSKGQRLILYDSDVHRVVGEGRIERVEYAEPEEIWEKYGSRIFLRKTEFDEYVARSPLGPRPQDRRIMTACVLNDLHRYEKPRAPSKRVTPSGYYLRGERD